MCKWMFSVLAISGLLVAGGCQDKQAGEKAPKKVVKYSYIDDPEAHALGYPDRFVPKTKEKTDWSRSHKEVVGGEEVEVVDGAVVEVCGGNCDK